MVVKPDVDFLRPARREPWWGWVWLAMGGLTLASAVWHRLAWLDERALLQLTVDERMLEQQAVRAVQRPPALAADSVRRRYAKRELELPWTTGFQAVETVTVEPIYLLSMRWSSSDGLLRLDGEAESLTHALAYVDSLDSQQGLRNVKLLSHEVGADAAGRVVTRFALSAQWTAP